MKISEINHAMMIYYNWLESIGFDETEIGVIRKVIERCAELERENFGLRKQIENMKRKEEARYKSDAWVD